MDELLAILSPAEPAWRLGGVWIISGLVVLAGLVGQRRLPNGIGDGLFVAGLSGMLFAAYLPMHDPERSGVQLCAVLTALAVLWRFAPRWRERAVTTTPRDTGDAATVIRSHAVLLCGAAVAGVSLRFSPEAPRDQRLAVTLCLMLVFALALRPRAGGGLGLSRYAWLGLLACALRIWVLPDVEAWPPMVLSASASAGGLLALAAALVPIFTHWRRRRRAWRSQTERLLEGPPRLRVWWAGVQILAGLTGIAALAVRHEPLAPIGPALASLAASVAGYRQWAGTGGSLALVLACEAVVLAALAWLPDFGFNALAGAAVAGLWMLWLVRFWRQQLHDGQAWTFSGQLIGSARQIGCAVAVICFVLGVAAAGVPEAGVPWRQAIWGGGAFVLVLLFSRALLRTAAEQTDWLSPASACLALLAALVPLETALAAVTKSWPQWPILLAAGLLLLALLAARERQAAEVRDWLYDAHIGGFLPVAILCVGWTAGAGAFWIVTLPTALIGFGLRWPRHSEPLAAAHLSPGGGNL